MNPFPSVALPASAGEPASSRSRVEALCAVAGRQPGGVVHTPNIPVVRTSTVLFDRLADCDAAGLAVMRGEAGATTYGTAGTPTTLALATAVAQLEGGADTGFRSALMPSGLSAISAALYAFLQAGDHLLMADSVYGPARLFATGLLARAGVSTTFYDPAIGAGIEALMQPNTRVVYVESPGSYTFEIQDIPAMAAVAHRHGAKVMLDNAWASPLLARPFDWGVDVSIIPLTKYWAGHADVLMGAVVVRDADWLPLWQTVRGQGLCVGGDDAWLVLRGLRTLPQRMAQHEASGLALARWLQGRTEVRRVLHPALPDCAGHALWQRDFSGSNGLFSFELDPRFEPAIPALVEGRRHFGIGYSWGGFESLIMPARIERLRTVRPWTGGPLIRIHAGLAPVDELMGDLDEGLTSLRAAA